MAAARSSHTDDSMKRLLLALFLSAGPAFSAGAQDLDCENASDQATMDECANRSYRASDAKLNKTYRALERKVSPAGLSKLKAAQRAWLTYRDAQCAFNAAGTEGGSIHPMVLSMCLDALTTAQTEQLDSQLNCEEGDISCGGQ